RVAEAVSSGARVPAWSLAAMGSGAIQRQAASTRQQPAPAPGNYGDALSKVAEAFLKTKTGQDMVKYVTEEDPLGRDATEFVKTPRRHRRHRVRCCRSDCHACRHAQTASRAASRNPAGHVVVAVCRPQAEDYL